MLANPPHTLPRTSSRPRGFRARWYSARWYSGLRNWLWLLGHRARRYRIMRAYANETLRYGPMAIPSAMATGGPDLTIGVERRFPLQPDRATRFYRAPDEND